MGSRSHGTEGSVASRGDPAPFDVVAHSAFGSQPIRMGTRGAATHCGSATPTRLENFDGSSWRSHMALMARSSSIDPFALAPNDGGAGVAFWRGMGTHQVAWEPVHSTRVTKSNSSNAGWAGWLQP
jgi:hypothetical protein